MACMLASPARQHLSGMHARCFPLRIMTRIATLLSCAVIAACGGSNPEPKTPDGEAATSPTLEPAPQTKRTSKNAPSVSQELGEIDKAATERTFSKLEPQIASCHRAGVKRIEY